MSNPEKAADDMSPLANAYLLTGLVALILFGLLLVPSARQLAIIPTLIGAAGLAFRWRSGALLFLASVAIGQLYLNWFPIRLAREATILPVLGLVYVIAQYRLLGLTTGVITPDSASGTAPPRPATSASQEFVAALLTGAVAAGGAFILWTESGKLPAPWPIGEPMHWRLGLLAWALLGGLVLASAVLRYLGWRRLSRVEAALFLQDGLWHETRREQRRINRWRAWALRRR